MTHRACNTPYVHIRVVGPKFSVLIYLTELLREGQEEGEMKEVGKLSHFHRFNYNAVRDSIRI